MANICRKCFGNILSHSRVLRCIFCKSYSHIACYAVSRQEYDVMNEWVCIDCLSENLPFYNIEDDNEFKNVIYEQIYGGKFDFKRLNEKMFVPFELNQSYNIPTFDMDPDVNYFRESRFSNNTICNYYTEETFARQFSSRNDKMKNGLSIYHHNIRSLPNQVTNMNILMEALQFEFDFIGISETWLTPNNCDLYDRDGYTHCKKYRANRRGGGISLFIKDTIKYKERHDLDLVSDPTESIFIEIDKCLYKTDRNIIVGLLYRPPNEDMNTFNFELAEILKILSSENKIVYLIGDYNIDLLKTDVHSHSSEFLDTLLSNNFIPLINKPTRDNGKTATIIDNIFTNEFSDNKYYQGIIFSDISDHFPIFHINENTGIDKAMQDNTTWKRDVTIRNINNFVGDCVAIDWDFVCCYNDTQLAYTEFHNTLSEIYEKHFPIKKIKGIYKNRKPWLTEALKFSIKQKNKLYIKQLKHKSDINVLTYKRYKCNLNRLIRKAERDYYNTRMTEYKSDLKKSWNLLKIIINKSKNKKEASGFKYKDTIITNKQVIADKFNEFFVNVGPNLARNIPNTKTKPTAYLKNKVMESFFLQPVSEDELVKVITNLKNSAPGWDGYQAQILKKIKHTILRSILHICNLSFSTGVFPLELKLANVVPLYKSGDDMVYTNYRPVSILPIVSKIIERLMYNRLLSFLNKHKVLYDYQFGFRQKYSTYMALLTLVDRVSNALDQGDAVIGIFLDFSKAFDTVDHSILLEKLQWYGIRGIPLAWFTDYLANRKQCVTYSGIKSSVSSITCGVPQGSILGPLLFLVYINDLSTVAQESFPLLFADDTSLYYKGKNLNDIAHVINKELSSISDWLAANKLSLNVDKTNYVIFTRNSKKIHDVDISIKGKTIQRVYSTKFLGVHVDSQLNWKAHIAYTSQKLSKCCGILYKARRFLHKETLLTLYYTFAYPYFTYCNIIWGNTYKTYLSQIEKLQKKIIRIITCSKYRAHTLPLYNENRLLNIYDIHKYACGIFMYKYCNGELPDVFGNMFVRNTEIHSYTTRQHTNFHIPICRSDFLQRCIRYNGTIVWNSIPNTIQMSHTLNSFKYTYKRHLLQRNL